MFPQTWRKQKTKDGQEVKHQTISAAGLRADFAASMGITEVNAALIAASSKDIRNRKKKG